MGAQPLQSQHFQPQSGDDWLKTNIFYTHCSHSMGGLPLAPTPMKIEHLQQKENGTESVRQGYF